MKTNALWNNQTTAIGRKVMVGGIPVMVSYQPRERLYRISSALPSNIFPWESWSKVEYVVYEYKEYVQCEQHGKWMNRHYLYYPDELKGYPPCTCLMAVYQFCKDAYDQVPKI